MQLHFGIEALTPDWASSVVCIGTFDGVHLGHQQVIGTGVAQARRAQAPCIVLTFDRHPASILAPDRCPKVVSSLEARLERFQEQGVDIAVILAFDRALSLMEAEDFFSTILVEKLKARELVVGHDFAMGHNRRGTPAWLSERMPTTIIAPFLIDGHRVSSSAVRQAVEEGRLADAHRWLGHPFEISGIVGHGERVGRTLGYPTINIVRGVNQVTPADGVYAGNCRTPVGTFKAAISVGSRPTFGVHALAIEAYLLQYPGTDLYGRHVRLQIASRLRGQVQFDSADELVEQMKRDVDAVESLP